MPPLIPLSVSPVKIGQEGGVATAAECLVVTAFIPQDRSDDSFFVTVWLHRESELAEIVKLEADENRVKGQSKHGVVIASGADLSVVFAGGSPDLEPIVTEDSIRAWSGQRANISLPVSCQNLHEKKPWFLNFRLESAGAKLGNLPVLINTRSARQAPNVAAPEEVWLFPRAEPHVFLSYRRAQADVVDRVRLHLLNDYGYKVFMDVSPECGLEGGRKFQPQLEEHLARAQVFVPVFTPMPSGEDEERAKLSYLACVKDSVAQNRVDWCYRELQLAMRDSEQGSKLIIPLYRNVNIGEELRDLPADIAKLAEFQCIQLVDTFFKESVRRVHNGIQACLREMQAREG